jgi:succinate dehydrogenase/fumarate reductase cytochrome b subunit
MPKQDELSPEEVESSASQSRYVIDWVTHVRRRGLGMWAWLLHRITAVLAIVAVVSHMLANQFGFIIVGGRLVTIDLLVFSLSYHALNGVRVILIEASGWMARNEDRMFIVVLVATALFIGFWVYVVGL